MPDTYAQLLVHVVFSTKQRLPVLTKPIRERLFPYIGGILNRECCRLYAVGGVADHIHLLFGYRPSRSIAELVQRIKGNSSHWLNKNDLLPDVFAWQEGYGAFSVSLSQLESVSRYVLNQETHHQTRTLETEWEALLIRHRLERID